MKKLQFVAHRGAWQPSRRENSLAAIERAVGTGRFEWIEIDVRRTRADDNGRRELLVTHDDRLNREYDLQRVPKRDRQRWNQRISHLTYADIQAEKLQFALLQDAFKAAEGGRLLVELKAHGALDRTLEVIDEIVAKKNKWQLEDIAIASLDWDLLEAARAKRPDLNRIMLYGWKSIFKGFARRYKGIAPTFVGFSKYFGLFVVFYARFRGVTPIYIFTVNSPWLSKLYAFIGAKGLMTDHINLPEKLVNYKHNEEEQ